VSNDSSSDGASPQPGSAAEQQPDQADLLDQDPTDTEHPVGAAQAQENTEQEPPG